MKSQRILELLTQASRADWRRANAIQCELGEATAAMRADGTFEIDTPAAGIHSLMNNLFVRLYQTNPALLPSMLPVFEIMCGDREVGMIVLDYNYNQTA